MNRSLVSALVALTCVAWLSPLGGCKRSATGESVVVSAAISLRPALRELVRCFPGGSGSIHLNFGASGFLATQIEQGAPAAIFLSADPRWIERLRQRGLVRRQIVGFVRGDLVLVVPVRAAPRWRGRGSESYRDWLKQLASPSVRRIAIGNPRSVPLGKHSKQALVHVGLWSALSPKLIFAEHAAQVLDYVRRGEVDAALVYATDLALYRRELHRVVTIPELAHGGIRYAAALLVRRSSPLAERFLRFLLSAEARPIWRRYGFRLAASTARYSRRDDTSLCGGTLPTRLCQRRMR